MRASFEWDSDFEEVDLIVDIDLPVFDGHGF